MQTIMQADKQRQPDSVARRTAYVSGNFRTQAGLASNWSPNAEPFRMNNIGDGVHMLKVKLTPGQYEYKITINGSWDENYGADGERGGGNKRFKLAEAREVTFIFQDHASSKRVIEQYESITSPVIESMSWERLDAEYGYDEDDLGCAYDSGKATLKLWAPLADEMKVSFYDKHDAELEIGGMALTRGERGVWHAEVDPHSLDVDDMRGYYYQYEITHGQTTRKALDPYAKSMAEFRVSPAGMPLGGDRDAVGKAAIIDLRRTEPEGGWPDARIDGYARREDAIIYETHVRDFTSDPAIEGDLRARWGTFKAFIDKLDYIRSLGVTHVQLLPVMAWYYGDEAAMDTRELQPSTENNQYNWGYDPHNYFTPDGAYSGNARDPELRVKELKALVAAIHGAGMGVILDVVYTHMAKPWLLEDIVPGYYFYRDANGELLGGFGCNLATNHAMADKLMIDSVRYWFEEYRIDGMRWDMMGDATRGAVQRAYDAAAAIHPNPLFIGEGWRTFSGHLGEPELAGQGADQDWMGETDDVGVFSDEFRNELKSGYGSEGQPRFLTGGAREIATLFRNLKAQPGNTTADAPGDMVQYLEAHDNLTLHDVIAVALKANPEEADAERQIHRRIRLGHALLFTAQGTIFMQAGQEYGRTKPWRDVSAPHTHPLHNQQGETIGHFVHNSYASSDAVNKFDWGKATDAAAHPECAHTRAYTAGLIALRKSTNAFRLGDKETIDRNVTLVAAPEIGDFDLVIAYRCQSTDDSGAYYVFVNADSQERTLTLPVDLSGGEVLVDGSGAGSRAIDTWSGFQLSQGSIALEPLTAVVIRMRE